jgi:hypothetical protein
MAAFFFDLLIYHFFPFFLPTLSAAASFITSYLLFRNFGVLISLAFWVLGRQFLFRPASQWYLLPYRYRSEFGWILGVTLTFIYSVFSDIAPYYGDTFVITLITSFILALVFATFFHFKKPGLLPRRKTYVHIIFH